MNAAALYDLDGEKSVKTVHKAKEATKRGGAGNSEEEEDNSQEQEGLEEEEVAANLRTGNTPRSGRVRFQDDDMDDAEEEPDDPSHPQQFAGGSAPASDVGSPEQVETGRGG